MEERKCMRCGTQLPYGSLVYMVQVKVFADFDGVILESEEESQQPLDQLLEQIKNEDPKELEKEVYEEFTLVLCKRCRDRFVDDTLHPWEGSDRIPKSPDRILH
jgi:hypothetical protein